MWETIEIYQKIYDRKTAYISVGRQESREKTYGKELPLAIDIVREYAR